MFGCQLLFEVEAFRADELSSPEEARILLEECADIALANTTSGLEQDRRVRRRPEWLPDLIEAVRGLRRDTIAAMETATNVPPYRWRLPTDVYTAAWHTVNGPRPSSEIFSVNYEDLISELQTRDIRRVFVLQPPSFAEYSCETDVTLLAERRYDWPHATDQDGYLTNETFDWVVDVDMYGLWQAYGWA